MPVLGTPPLGIHLRMRIVLPALTLSAFMAFQVAADPKLLNIFWSTPNAPQLPARFMPKPPQFRLNEVVRAMAQKHNVEPAFVKSIIAAESAFNPKAVSSKGAVGLMQLMPQTAQELGADPQVPEQNIEAGATYLSRLMYRYRNYRDQLKRTIAAYNAGPGNVDRYHGVPPFKETRTYVKRVLTYYKVYAVRPPL